MPGVLPEGAGLTPRARLVVLAAILLAALALRLPGLGWGLPPATPEVRASDLRCSYAFDEDDILTHVSFDQPRLFHWGTLHFILLRAWMSGAEELGCCGYPWRKAYYDLVPGDFDRVYIAGRLFSLLEGLVLIILVYGVGRDVYGAATGLWAAALVGASPVHLLASTQIRVDLTMVCLLTGTIWLGLRAQKGASVRIFLLLGLCAGLAIVAKYTAIFLVTPILLAALWERRFPRRATLAVMGGMAAGALLGQPYVLLHLPEMVTQVREQVLAGHEAQAQFLLGPRRLLAWHAAAVARFLVGPVAALLALGGLWRIARERSQTGWLLLAGLAGVVVSLVPLLWPLLRYQIPLLPFVALAAAVALAAIPPLWRWPLGAAALTFPLAASLAQISYQRTPHPANQALPFILAQVPPGTAVARLVPEMPPLDRKVYPMGLNPLLMDLTRDPPAWVLDTNLHGEQLPPKARDLLASRYVKVGHWEAPRILGWATLGEAKAPHDWKYTHATQTLYRRASP
ncbi:MAG: glycosyltransferase family 39 protein [Acidobacteria bacterium]|nr:glycosyltransferase family 39 protein [Acidobacteriota bacterium]